MEKGCVVGVALLGVAFGVEVKDDWLDAGLEHVEGMAELPGNFSHPLPSLDQTHTSRPIEHPSQNHLL